MGSNFKIVLIFMLISTVLSEAPVYSANYAKIRYQPRGNWESPKAELNLEERRREEVTEKMPQRNANSSSDEAKSYDITTESESEQINLTRFVYKNIIKDKLVDDTENYRTATAYGGNINDITRKETVFNETVDQEIIGDNKNEKFVREDAESLDDLDESEISDLNQGMYYIYHPDLLLQKVVYRSQADPNIKEYSTQINYENGAPILESIYTYDPRTFVLQRLILRPQKQA